MKKIKNLIRYNNLAIKMCGKSKMLDILLSRLILKVPFDLYIDFCFYDVPWNERSKYILDHAVYAMKYNPGINRVNHDDKRDIMKKIYSYLKRRVVLDTYNMSKSEFISFCDGLDSFFYKPNDGCGGGIVKYILMKDSDLNKIYDKIKQSKAGVLEETIKQHPVMTRLGQDAVSTIRFTVFKGDFGAKLVFATLRMSISKGSVVDNASAGGCFASIDVDKGEICKNAYTGCSTLKSPSNELLPLISKNGMDRHSLTGTPFVGFKIPFFSEAKNLVLNMAENIDFYGRRLLGFDIAISENGPVVVEVNACRPGLCELYQTANKEIPLKEYFEKTLKENIAH